MKSTISVLLVALLIAGCSEDTQKTKSKPTLVQIDSRDYGDTKYLMKIVEIERNPKISKLKLTFEKLGPSVGSAMFIARGFYEVAKSRETE